MFIITIMANFYNKEGELVFRANSGEPDERIITKAKSAFGFSGGGFGLEQGMSEEELELTHTILSTRGRIHQLLSGNFEGQEITLDGKFLSNTRITRCKIYVNSGEFVIYKNVLLENNEIFFGDAASNIKHLLEGM